MARLLTNGFEVRRASTTALTTSDGEGVYYDASVTFNTANPRSGGACLQPSTDSVMHYDTAGTLDRTYWLRFYMRRTANPSGGLARPLSFDASTAPFYITIPAGTNNVVLNGPSGVITTLTGALSSDSAWHKWEIQLEIPTAGNSTLQFWIDDVSLYNSTPNLGNTIWATIRIGQDDSPNPGTPSLFDDVALNDETGASQNGRCGDGRIYHLVPTVLGSGGRGNWVDGGGGTTNLHESLNNTPPTGTAAGSNGTQIENPTSGSSAAEFDTQTYDAVIPSNEDITLVAGLWKLGVSSTAGTGAGTARLFNNPDVGADTTVNFEGSTAIAGTDPAGWRTYKSAYVHLPSVTRSAVAKLRITKTELTTRVHSCDYMAVQVETGPAAATVQEGWGVVT